MDNLFTLSTALKTAVESEGRTEFHYFRIIQKYWKIIIGEALAEKTSPVRLVRKTLYILVPDSAYTHQLSYFTERLIDLIASPAILGEDKVLQIKFRVGEKAKAPEIRIEHKECLKPLKKHESEKVDKISGKIKDQELRGVFASYMDKIKRRDNGQREL